jgi:hypothetical protein
VVRLAGDAGGTAPFAVDDRLTLIAHRRDGTARRWVHDFRVAGRIVPLPPTDITPALGTDLTDLEMILEDLEPDTWSNTALWLLPCAESTLVATPTLDNLPATTQPPPSPTPPATGVPLAQVTGGGANPHPADPAPLLPPKDPPAGPGVGLWWLLMVVPISGAAWFFLRRRHPVGALQRTYQLTIYDTTTRQQYQEDLGRERFPLGIARSPLRLVAVNATEAIGTLTFVPSDQLPTLTGQAGAATLHIQVDGFRLPLEPEPTPGNTTPVLGQEHSHA